MKPISKRLTLNVALLGFDQTSHVNSGENSGKLLHHDFVVLDYQQFAEAPGKDGHYWQLDKLLANKPAAATGIALWVTAGRDPTPLQATGGWLE